MTPCARRGASGPGTHGILKTRSSGIASAITKASRTIPAPTLVVFILSIFHPVDLLLCPTASRTMKRAVFSEKAPKPIGPYSQAVEVGDYVFCSGQTGTDPKTGTLVGGVVAQNNRARKDLKEGLAKVWAALEDVGQANGF